MMYGVDNGPSYESRFAELSRRFAGRNTHCFPRRTHLVILDIVP